MDRRAQFAERSRATPVDVAARQAFVRHRAAQAVQAHAHSSVEQQRSDRRLRTLAHAIGAPHLVTAIAILQAIDAGTPPIPGGVGFGLLYWTDLSGGFVSSFVGGTAIAFDVVAPTPPGGSVSTFLYLTATNRAGLGVEAFVSYNGQDDTHFKVYDWARVDSDPWQLDIPLAGLDDYRHGRFTHDVTLGVFPVWNSTYQIDGAQWRNDVSLHNRTTCDWDLVYRYDYAATDVDQQPTDLGGLHTSFWGPIVETFEDTYVGTDVMGFLSIQLASADGDVVWADWAPCTAIDTLVSPPTSGFTTVFLDPNTDVAVRS